MSWFEDVKDTLMSKWDSGKEDREWDKSVASLCKLFDQMADYYLVKDGGEAVEIEVEPEKAQYMLEVLDDDLLKSKYEIRQIGQTLYEVRLKTYSY